PRKPRKFREPVPAEAPAAPPAPLSATPSPVGPTPARPAPRRDEPVWPAVVVENATADERR
ncbi:MAG: hypothetical protein ACAI43_26320, partial [Phycisphaerae bacterium]